MRRRPIQEALSFPQLLTKSGRPTSNDIPVYLIWVEPLPLFHRADTANFMERKGFPAWLKKLVPNAFSIKPPGDCRWPSGWEGSELHGISSIDDDLPKMLNCMLESEQEAERGENSQGMKSILAELTRGGAEPPPPGAAGAGAGSSAGSQPPPPPPPTSQTAPRNAPPPPSSCSLPSAFTATGLATAANKKGESAAASKGKKSKAKIKLTPQHLYVAYVWYLKQREARGEGLVPGDEESFCLKCKDGGNVLLCDYSGCTKSYHPACANLKTIPEGIWECPRHRCVQCGSGPSKTDVHGRPRRPDLPGEAGYTLLACQTCPITYCERCLPKEVTFAGVEIVCESCQELLSVDMASLQRDLIEWKPELFADM